MIQKYVKIWGCKRTSTNYLEWLLRQNTEATIFKHRFGWKHGAPGTEYERVWCEHESFNDLDEDIQGLERDDLYHIVMIKNPIPWYRSVRGWHGHPVDEFDCNYTDSWNTNYYNWREALNNWWNGAFIRSVDLLKNPKSNIKKLPLEYNEGFEDTNMRISPQAEIVKERGEFDPTLYTEYKWFDSMDNEVIDQIRGHTLDSLVDRFNFIMEESEIE